MENKGMKHIIKPAFSLFIIAAITTALLTLVYSLTLEPIANQRKKAQEKVKNAIFPEASAFSEIIQEKQGNIDAIFECYKGNELIGYIIELSPPGYSGNIYMMVGISKTANNIAGMRILKHTETPGLGSLAVKENFFRKYDNRNLVPLRVVRSSAGENEIEAITGATITTRAITDAVNEAINWYKAIYNGVELP
jgi:electron transport complex protein RnfG